MDKQIKWEKFYKETPLEKIPWQKTQDDYLKNIVNSSQVDPGTALDLGCGTGMKSIFLAQKGFEVTGVDISETAIKHANANARKAALNVNFIAADATDLSFLGNKKFDFILDWANLHGIPENKREKYISEIVAHTKDTGQLLLRCFGRKQGEENFSSHPMGRISLFLEDDIKTSYGKYFKIIGTNTSKSLSKYAPSKFFYEFLMEKL